MLTRGGIVGAEVTRSVCRVACFKNTMDTALSRGVDSLQRASSGLWLALPTSLTLALFVPVVGVGMRLPDWPMTPSRGARLRRHPYPGLGK